MTRSLDPTVYSDPVIAEREIATIFESRWLGIGRADQVSAPGDFMTRDIAGHAIILTRDAAGKLRALANVCRHRGSRLVDGCGQTRLIRCPFHSWSYGLDGQLAAAPHMDMCEGFQKSDHGLMPYRVEERFGFVFVSLGDAGDLDDQLDDFDALHAPWPLDKLVTHRRRTLRVNCNWKAFLEVFNEYYHLASVHPASIDSLYEQPKPGDRVVGQFATQFGKTEGTGGLLEGAQDSALPPIPGLESPWRDGVRYTWAFPTMTFAAGRDALWVYEAFPDGPDWCDVVQTVCFHPDTMAQAGFAQRADAYTERADAAIDEDIPVLAFQHRGLQSRGAVRGPLNPLLEPSVARFAGWYEALMS